MPPKRWTTSEFLPATDWKHSAETGPDNTASASTSNGGSASSGPTPDPPTSRSWTTTEEVPTMTTITPIHPGEILMEEFLEPLQDSQNRLAVAIGVPPRRINGIVHGKRRISADTALRLARYFGTTDLFWLNLQVVAHLEVEPEQIRRPEVAGETKRRVCSDPSLAVDN